MSFVSGITGSDPGLAYGLTATVSGSGFGAFSGSGITGGGGTSENIGFQGRVFQVQWRSVDQPWINYGGFLGGNVIFDGGGGFNKQIQIPRGQIPSGQYDLVVELPLPENDAPFGFSTSTLPAGQKLRPAIRYNVAGNVATRTITSTGSLVTTQYQDTQLSPGASAGFTSTVTGGTPEFGYASGSVVG